MRTLLRFVATLLVGVLLEGSAFAGGMITSFLPGGGPQKVVLPGVPVIGLVAEFLDPGNTGLGKSLGILLWRETLTAISDQGGAGVIIARSPKTMRLTDMLKKDYHRAAIEIARNQNARMALWGVVAESGGTVFLDSYLTLLPEIIGDDLRINFVVHMGKVKGFRGLSAGIQHSSFNFSPVEITRKVLFERPLITRRETIVRERPEGKAGILLRLGSGRVLQAVDMEGTWFKVRLEDGRSGWVEISEDSPVDVPPREVEGHRKNVKITEDAAGKTSRGKINLDGVYRVLDLRYVKGRGSCYRLALAGRSAWVDANLVAPRFSLPVVNFMAGLYRYQRKNMVEAQKAFSAFLAETGDPESNVNRAAAFQLQGASLLSMIDASRNQTALDAMDKAVDLTPYDPAAYNLRVLARLTFARTGPALEDLEKALNLDPRNEDSRGILGALVAWAGGVNSEYGELREILRVDPRDAERIRAIERKYER